MPIYARLIKVDVPGSDPKSKLSVDFHAGDAEAERALDRLAQAACNRFPGARVVDKGVSRIPHSIAKAAAKTLQTNSGKAFTTLVRVRVDRRLSFRFSHGVATAKNLAQGAAIQSVLREVSAQHGHGVRALRSTTIQIPDHLVRRAGRKLKPDVPARDAEPDTLVDLAALAAGLLLRANPPGAVPVVPAPPALAAVPA